MRLALPPTSCKVYTPPMLAEAMVDALRDEAGISWLEPAHGKGIFLESMARHGIPKERISAIDLDPRPSAADGLANTLRGVDFLRWAFTTDLRFDRIIGNPPYVAISQLPVSLRRSAADVCDTEGKAIGGGANVWYAFVLASLRLLRPHGCLAFVLPSAAEFANYSAAIRAAVGRKFARLELFRCTQPLFSEVQEGCLIAIARGFQAQPFTMVRRQFRTAANLIDGLSRSDKINGRACPVRVVDGRAETVLLSSVADIRLGGVTGDASYFLMNDKTRRALGLPVHAFTPVVSRARHLRTSLIDRNKWDELKREGERVWMFNPSAHALLHPAVDDYLKRKRELGGCNREAFKVSSRQPWYRTVLPPTPHAFLSGMCQFGPWFCMNEMDRLNANNTLYVVTFKTTDENEWYGYALALLSSQVQQQLRRAGRRYADGLIKYEPGSLAALRMPRVSANANNRQAYKFALEAFLSGRDRDARGIADSVLQSQTCSPNALSVVGAT